MDIVIVSLVVILPVLTWSWMTARKTEWAKHKKIQLWTAGLLAFAVLLFEIDMRLSGGIFEMMKGGTWEGTFTLNFSVYFHTFLSISTTIIWGWLIYKSLKRFDKEPRPNDFSKTHKRWGTVAMVGMVLTGVTGVEIYVLGFVL
jgi:uncharacterized membrane protein YozB (DUF420 family)